MLAALLPRVMLIRGTLISTGHSFKGLFVGNPKIHLDFCNRFLRDGYAVHRLWRLPLPLLRLLISVGIRPFDLAVFSLPEAIGPHWIREVAEFRGRSTVVQTISLEGGWEGLKRRAYRDKRGLLNGFRNKTSLKYRVSHDAADLERFYDEMFVPHAKLRYGRHAVIDSRAEIERFFNRGMLLMIEQAGRPIAAALCREVPDRLEYFRGGISGDAARLGARDASSALYFFQFDYAISRGLKELDCLESRSFLTDGVYRYKASWGALAEPRRFGGDRLYYVLGKNAGVLAELFQHCPTLVESAGSLHAIAGQTLQGPEISVQQESWYTRGISAIHVFYENGHRKRLDI